MMGAATGRVYGVILAAGLSRRFGAEKLRQLLSGKPVFLWVLEAVCKSSLAGAVVVCRQELAPDLPSDSKVRTIINPTPAAGQSESMRLGLAALPEQTTHVLFLLADQPLITTALIDEYVDLANHGSTLACFSSNDYLGPPALFAKNWFDCLRGLTGDSGAKKILVQERNALQRVSAQFQGQEKDLDYKDNLQPLEQLMQKYR